MAWPGILPLTRVLGLQYPLQGPVNHYSIHTWIEAPFQSSGDECCAFDDVDDIFLNLDTGGVAVGLPTYVGTNPILLQVTCCTRLPVSSLPVLSPSGWQHPGLAGLFG